MCGLLFAECIATQIEISLHVGNGVKCKDAFEKDTLVPRSNRGARVFVYQPRSRDIYRSLGRAILSPGHRLTDRGNGFHKDRPEQLDAWVDVNIASRECCCFLHRT
jgi:hypothetical protein